MNLVANALACERNGRVVFSGLDFSLGRGEMVELRGPNGAGKSSLLRLLAGLVPRAGGSLTLTENDAPQDEATLPRRLHFIAHQDAMKPALTVAENLSFWAQVMGGAGIAQALAAFSLAPLRNEPVQLLSAGQRRRLTLSRLFLAPRPLWLLDEPTTALDAQSQATLVQHIRTHLSAGGMVMAATHGDIGLAPTRMLNLGSG